VPGIGFDGLNIEGPICGPSGAELDLEGRIFGIESGDLAPNMRSLMFNFSGLISRRREGVSYPRPFTQKMPTAMRQTPSWLAVCEALRTTIAASK